MNSIPYIDGLVKEYLLFRGFTQTVTNFETERKSDRLRGFQVSNPDGQVEKIIKHIWTLVEHLELRPLLEFWGYLDERFFSKLDEDFRSTIQKVNRDNPSLNFP